MRNPFTSFIKRFGTDVVVTHRTPKTVAGEVVKNDKGRIIYDEEEVELRCNLTIFKGTEVFLNNATVQEGDGTGSFLLEDQQYLNENSYLTKTYEDTGEVLKFKMQKPKRLRTKITVPLKSREI
jgi:hypothetical protein